MLFIVVMETDMKDLEKMEYPSYKKLAEIYSEYFSLGFLNKRIDLKLALISLIGYTVHKLREKNPNVTYYQVVYKLTREQGLPEQLVWAIAIIAEDFSYGCNEFPLFDLKQNEIIPKIKEILKNYLPF